MKLWEIGIAQVHHGVVNVWMPDDATEEQTRTEALRYTVALEADGALQLDLPTGDPAAEWAELDEFTEKELGEPGGETYMAFNLAPEYQRAIVNLQIEELPEN